MSPLDETRLTQDSENDARAFVLYCLSHGFTRSDLKNKFRAKFGQDHSDHQIDRLIEDIELKEDQQGGALTFDTQRQRQELPLSKIDRVTDDPTNQLSTSVAGGLMNFQAADQTRALLDDLTNKNVSEEPASKMASDPARGQSGAPRPPSPAGLPTIVTGHTVNPEPAIAVRVPPMSQSIPAYSPITPVQLDGYSLSTPDRARLSMNFDDTWGTYYGLDPRFDRLEIRGSGSGRDGRSNDGEEGGDYTRSP